MKKIGLVCATALMGMSLAACSNSASQKSNKKSSSSSVTTTKAVKHHKTHKESKKEPQSSSTSSNSVNQSSSIQATQSSDSSQSAAWSMQQQSRTQAAQNDTPTSEDQARAMLGGANGDLQATRTSNGWTFSGDGYTATVNDDGTILHN
ncbi:hypothetical protein [Limosilactobacillus reuteri]|uniref:hypothetical protein n=1 Tax=Limosilactobacillus reuteri TaxID=1598 RepID=UPI0021A512F4|nr:hypothetical protein [Limosilactobacillus reuteri]MCT3201444.1 hypothetical protein [Limosilactobacillus reuteri]